ADDLVGWNERKDGEVKRHPGIFSANEISRAQADEMIMAARLAAGWVTEEDLREPDPVEEEVAPAEDERPAVINVIEDQSA
ncbi:MAG: transcription termination/antitermination protein NusA, partial [Pseudomonadota bacterium]